MKTFYVIFFSILISGCAHPLKRDIVYSSRTAQLWQDSILEKCRDKGQEVAFNVWLDHKEFDFEQIKYIEKRIEQECLVKMGVMI